MFWVENKQGKLHIPGIMILSDDFSSEGEVHKLDINLMFDKKNILDIFFLMMYEEDNPMLLDFHDPIGLIAFYQNQQFAVYSGNYNQPELPKFYSFNNEHEIKLDSGSNGEYHILLNVKTVS